MAGILEFEMPTLKDVLEKVGGNENLLKEQTLKIRLWLKRQLHLPRDISDQRLRYFISRSKFNLEKAKKRLDLFYTLRSTLPEISSLDPLSDNMIECYKYIQVIYLPKLMAQNCRIRMIRIKNSEPSVFDVNAFMRYMALMQEIIAEEDIVVTEVVIIDVANFRVGHLAHFTPKWFKSFNMYTKANGTRVRAFHLINSPDIMDWIMLTIKSLLNAKLFNRIQIHTSGIESLYGIIPKSLLPADYGGEQPTMDRVAAMWHAKLASRRGWFLKQEKVRVDESLRSHSVINPDDLFGVAGTFQKLDID